MGETAFKNLLLGLVCRLKFTQKMIHVKRRCAVNVFFSRSSQSIEANRCPFVIFGFVLRQVHWPALWKQKKKIKNIVYFSRTTSFFLFVCDKAIPSNSQTVIINSAAMGETAFKNLLLGWVCRMKFTQKTIHVKRGCAMNVFFAFSLQSIEANRCPFVIFEFVLRQMHWPALGKQKRKIRKIVFFLVLLLFFCLFVTKRFHPTPKLL